MANKMIPIFLKNLKEKIRDRFSSDDELEVKKKIIVVNPRTGTRSIRTQDLKYFDVTFNNREIKKWYLTREVVVI